MEVGIYPFFIASHTSAWDQPNDFGINECYKAKFYKVLKRWRAGHPFSVKESVTKNADKEVQTVVKYQERM